MNTTNVNPATINIKTARAIAKDPISQWSNTPRVGKVKVFVSLNDSCWAPDGINYPHHGDFNSHEEFAAAFTAYDREASRASNKADRVVVNALMDAMGIDIGKMTYSRTAGCGCGCSGGFVAEATGRYDYYISATAEAL